MFPEPSAEPKHRTGAGTTRSRCTSVVNDEYRNPVCEDFQHSPVDRAGGLAVHLGVPDLADSRAALPSRPSAASGFRHRILPECTVCRRPGDVHPVSDAGQPRPLLRHTSSVPATQPAGIHPRHHHGWCLRGPATAAQRGVVLAARIPAHAVPAPRIRPYGDCRVHPVTGDRTDPAERFAGPLPVLVPAVRCRRSADQYAGRCCRVWYREAVRPPMAVPAGRSAGSQPQAGHRASWRDLRHRYDHRHIGLLSARTGGHPAVPHAGEAASRRDIPAGGRYRTRRIVGHHSHRAWHGVIPRLRAVDPRLAPRTDTRRHVHPHEYGNPCATRLETRAVLCDSHGDYRRMVPTDPAAEGRSQRASGHRGRGVRTGIQTDAVGLYSGRYRNGT